MVKVGDKVRIKTRIVEDACGDHPTLLLAEAGEILIVRAIKAEALFPIQISHVDITDKSFGVTHDEYEAVNG